MAIVKHRNELGGRATPEQRMASTGDLLQAVETAVGATLSATDNPKYGSYFLNSVMSEIDNLFGEDYMGPEPLIGEAHVQLPEGFQLQMGDLLTRFGVVVKRLKLTDQEDGVYYDNLAKWACNENLGMSDSDITGFLLGIGMGKGWTQEEMAKNGRQYTGPNAVPLQLSAEPEQPTKGTSLIDTMKKNNASNRPRKKTLSAFDATYKKEEKGTTRNEQALRTIMERRGR